MSKINKANYTKGEWKIDKELTAGGAPIIVSNTCWQNRKREIAKVLYAFGSEDPEVQANADRIVNCVNSHDDLLKACKMGLACLDIEAELVVEFYKLHKTSQLPKTTNRIIKVLNTMKDAIAKAKVRVKR